MNYTTGQFAKKAGVSVRTVRYYDQIGLLKPSFLCDNGYRCYDEKDLIRLQKIVILKYLGFSLNEIQVLLEEEKQEDMGNSLDMQIALLEQKITHMQVLKESLVSAKKMLKQNHMDWQSFQALTNIHVQDEKILEHYRNAKHLSIRIRLHDMFSQNQQKWFPWLLSHIDFRNIYRLLEIGCGNGALWQNCTIDMRNRELFLSDISQGMIDSARKALGENYSYMVFDCQNIPFKKGYFDAIVANHVMFYVGDIKKGLSEIRRVCKQDGVFYCTTYGKKHMKEITELAQEFDKRISLSDQQLSECFGLENAEAYLSLYFKEVTLYRYEDGLLIDDPQPLLEYIMSCHGNQNDILTHRLEEFRSFLQEKIKEKGKLFVTKDAGLWICKGDPTEEIQELSSLDTNVT